MITIQREFDSSIIDELKPHFVEDVGYTRDMAAAEMKSSMDCNSDDFCMIIARGEDKKIVGYILAWIPENRRYVYMGQAWCIAGHNVAESGMGMLIKWATEKDVDDIVCDTARSTSAIYRAWEFIERSVSMVKSLRSVSNG